MESSDNSKPFFLRDTAILMTIIFAVTYAMGWLYAYHFFSLFGFGMLQLNLPERDILMYGYMVVLKWFWLIAFLAIANMLCLFKIRSLKAINISKFHISLTIQITTVLLLFAMITILPRETALSVYKNLDINQFSEYRFAKINLIGDVIGDSKTYPADLRRDLENGNFKLLIQNDTFVLLIRPALFPGANIPVILINKSHLVSMRLF